MPCNTFYANFQNNACMCPTGYAGTVPNCFLQIHRYPFFEMNNSLTATDVADVSVYGGTAKDGIVRNQNVSNPGNFSIFDNYTASFDGQSIITFPKDLFERSPIMTFEFWLTTNNAGNTGYNRLLHFQRDYVETYTPTDSITLNRDGGNTNIMVDICGPGNDNTDCNFFVANGYSFDTMVNRHIVLTLDPISEKKVKLYVDGTLATEGDFTREFLLEYNTLTLGGNYVPSMNENLRGEVHEFSVWKGSMSSSVANSRYLNTVSLRNLQMPSSVPTSAPAMPTSIPTGMPSSRPTSIPTNSPPPPEEEEVLDDGEVAAVAVGVTAGVAAAAGSNFIQNFNIYFALM